VFVAPVRSAPPPVASHAPATECDPPFYFDDTGIRVFKKECVH
jgi:hypothetical protein